jgi:hypothetical protein
MKEIHELDVYRLAEELSDLIWFAFDNWPTKVQRIIGELGPKLNAFIKSTK